MKTVRIQFVKLRLPDVVFRSMRDCSRWIADHNLPKMNPQLMTDAMNRKKKAGKPVKFYVPDHEEYIIWLEDNEPNNVGSIVNEAVIRFNSQKIGRSK